MTRAGRWTGLRLAAPILGLIAATATAQQPGGLGGFFAASWGRGAAEEPAFDLADLGDVLLRFDASNDATVYTDGTGAVTQWVSTGSGGQVATVTAGSFQLVTTNGYKGVEIAANDSYMDFSPVLPQTNLYTGSGSTLIGIGQVGGLTSDDTLVFISSDQFRMIAQVAPQVGSNGRFDFVFNQNFTFSDGYSGYATDFFLDRNLYVGMRYPGSIATTSTNDIKVYTNGEEGPIGFGGLGTPADLQYIGGRPGRTRDSGIFHEICIIDRVLNQDELDDVHQYAIDKWGTPATN